MALTYNDDFKNAWVDLLGPEFEGQDFEILTAADEVLGTVSMPAALFAAAVAGVAALNASFDISITVEGIAAKFRAYTSATARQEGTVGIAGADINIASVDLFIGDRVRIQTWTLTFP